jgi:hypothetical protein
VRTRLDLVQPRPDDEQPRLHFVWMRLDLVQPRPDDEQPRLHLVRGRPDLAQPRLDDEQPRLHFVRSRLDLVQRRPGDEHGRPHPVRTRVELAEPRQDEEQEARLAVIVRTAAAAVGYVVMQSRFHQESFSRLSREYAPDPAATSALERRAGELGVALPESFVEWYGMRDGVEILRLHSNSDHPVAIERLGQTIKWRWQQERDWIREGLLVFMIENQAVCVWAVRLGDTADPPVVVARDPDLQWRPCAERFSTFIGCQIWDWSEVFSAWQPGGRVMLQAQDTPLRQGDLAFLRERFDNRPTTRGWPGDTQYRFERGEARVLVWESEGQADWWITAMDEDGLAALVDELWDCGDLHASLYCNDQRSQRVLEKLRRERVRGVRPST